MVKNPPAMQVTWVWSLGWEDPLEKGTATYSSIHAWRIPWIEEPGRIRCMGSQRVRHDWVIFTSPINKVYQAETYKTVCCESVISKILIRCIWEVGKPRRSLGSGLKEKVYCTALRMTSESNSNKSTTALDWLPWTTVQAGSWQLTWLQPPMHLLGKNPIYLPGFCPNYIIYI